MRIVLISTPLTNVYLFPSLSVLETSQFFTFYFNICLLICFSLNSFTYPFVSDCNCSKQVAVPLCKEEHDTQFYYQPLLPCISGTTSKRWFPIQNRSSSFHLSSVELEVHGNYCSTFNFYYHCFKTFNLYL